MPILKPGDSVTSMSLHVADVILFGRLAYVDTLSKNSGTACRAAGLAVAQRAAEWVGPSVPSLVKHVLDRIGQEEQQSNQEELAGKRHLDHSACKLYEVFSWPDCHMLFARLAESSGGGSCSLQRCA